MPKEYYTVGTFRSSSRGNVWYRVDRDEEGNLSCTCPGWCRRVARDGSRSCKHVRKVLKQGEAQVVTGSRRRDFRQEKPVQDKLGRRRFRI